MAQAQMIKLAVIFVVIVVLMWLKRPLYQAILAAILATAVAYRIHPLQCLALLWQVLCSWSSMSILVVLYLITFLQRMLEARRQISLAQQDLNGLFHNRRVNAAIAPLFIGLLPSAAAMILCGDIVKASTDGYLDRREQAFVTSWFRHIPESTLPTYTSVLLMSSLAGIPLPGFMLGMAVPVLVLALLAYLPYIRKLPRDTGTPPSQSRRRDALGLLRHLWTLLAILALILGFGLPVTVSVGAVILLAAPVYRFGWRELQPLFAKAFERRVLVNTFLVLVFKEFIVHTGVVHALPELLDRLPIPVELAFALLFLLGCILIGASGIIALGTVMAFAAIPGAGVPLMVLLMCFCHAGSQLSPLHVCLVVAAEYYGVTMGDLVRKTLPVALAFCALMVGYYYLLLQLV